MEKSNMDTRTLETIQSFRKYGHVPNGMDLADILVELIERIEELENPDRKLTGKCQYDK